MKWIAIICCNILIVENAIKYNHSGGQVIVEAYQKEKQVYLSVEDTGSGIPEELKERVFEPFFRVDKSRSRELGGVGGLAIIGIVFSCRMKLNHKTHKIVIDELDRVHAGGRKEDVSEETRSVIEKLTGISYDKCFGNNNIGYKE